MSKFIRQFTAERDFEGDHVKVTFRGMKRKHALDISKFTVTENGETKLVGSQEELLPAMDSVLKDCVVSLEGLTDCEGQPVTVDDVMGEMYFMELTGWMLEQLMSGSKVAEKSDDEKNSAEPSAAV